MTNKNSFLRKTCYFMMSFAFLFSGCNQMPTQNNDPALIINSLQIHGMQVNLNAAKPSISLNTEKIETKDIRATFSYGKEKDKELAVTIKGGSFTVNKTKPSQLELSVDAVKGLHSSWSKIITVIYDASLPPPDPDLTLTSMIIHRVKVKDKKAAINADEINSSDIIAKFNYGSISDTRVNVTIKDGPFIVDKNTPKMLELTIPAVKGKYKAWKISIEISFSREAPQTAVPLVSSIIIEGGSVKGSVTSASEQQLTDIMAGKDVTVHLKGSSTLIVLLSDEVTEWASVKVNGKDTQIYKGSDVGITNKSIVITDAVKLPQVDKTEDISIIVEGKKKGKNQILKFKIHRDAGAVDIPNLELFINEDKIDNPYNLSNKKGKIIIQKKDAVVKINIGDDKSVIAKMEIDGQVCNVKENQQDGSAMFYYEHLINNISDQKDIKIVITPMNNKEYITQQWDINLKYEPIADNTDFQEINDSNDVSADITKWYNSPKEHEYFDDLGAQKAIIIAATKNPASKVYYTIINEPLGETFKEEYRKNGILLTAKTENSKVIHASNEITLKMDKPTYIYLWVVSENGNPAPIDSTSGNEMLILNPVHLYWDYTSHEDATDFQYNAYDVVEVDKSKIKNNQVHLLFFLFEEQYGYKMDENYSFPECQKKDKIKKLAAQNPYMAYYETVIDVSKLLDKSVEELEAAFPVLEVKEGKVCFVYKVKLKLKS